MNLQFGHGSEGISCLCSTRHHLRASKSGSWNDLKTCFHVWCLVRGRLNGWGLKELGLLRQSLFTSVWPLSCWWIQYGRARHQGSLLLHSKWPQTQRLRQHTHTELTVLQVWMWLHWVLRLGSHKAAVKMLAGLGSHLETQGEYACKLIQVFGRIHFLVL